MRSLSVDTQVSCDLDLIDSDIAYAKSGLPLISIMFLFRIPLLPPRARITEIIFMFILYLIKVFNNYYNQDLFSLK